MSHVIYNSKRLIPAPFVSITKNYQKSGNGDIIGKTYNITLNGTIVAWMGSPTSSGSFWTTSGYPPDETLTANDRLWAIQRKQAAIRELFSDEGLQFEVQALNGMNPVRCNPRINEISFGEGTWYDKCEYTIQLECDELYPDTEDSYDQYISNATEEWSVDTNDEAESLSLPRTYTLTHNVSAVGKKFFDDTGAQPQLPWQYARDYVLGKLGFDSTMALSSGVSNLPSFYGGWNHSRNNSINESEGSYSVTETWVLASGSALEELNIDQSKSMDSALTKVSIRGNIRGLEQRNSNLSLLSSKWTNAQTKFAEASGLAYLRAQQYSGLSNLNIDPISTTIGKNVTQGTIDYTYEYDNRPMNLVEGALSESITISDNVGGELFASIFVLGRTRGPVLQDLGTKPGNTRTLNIELIVPPPTISDRTVATAKSVMITNKPSSNPAYSGSIYNLIYAANPLNNGFSTVYQNQPQESWDFRNGRYNYSTVWNYE